MTEAYITLLTNNSYASGALVLAYSLRASNTTKQIAVLVTGAVSHSIRDRLSAVFDAVIEIGEINSHSTKNLKLLGRPELGVTLTKIHVFNQTQYSKVVFLDADTLVLKNVDDLFDTANGSLEDEDRNKRFAAAPDAGWPDCFNSGVFVCKPSYQDYNGLFEMATQEGTFDGGDQGLLNSYFSEWSRGESSNRLPFLYNTTPTAVYSYAPAYQQYKDKLNIVHFIGSFKPWQWLRFADGTVFPRNTSSKDSITLVQQWWNIFDRYIGGKPSDFQEVSHGYELPHQSQWDSVGLDGKLTEMETQNKNHYDGWFQPYDHQHPKPVHQNESADDAVEKNHLEHHCNVHEHRDSEESLFVYNPHHLTDYHYQPEPETEPKLEFETEPETEPEPEPLPHRYHHRRHDSALDIYSGYQNAWDIDEDPRMTNPPSLHERPIEIETALSPEVSPYPSGKGYPVFPWESSYSNGTKSVNPSVGSRTPSRVYYNYNATPQERQEYYEWELARRREIKAQTKEEYRMEEFARYERERLIAEAQERVLQNQVLESSRLVNAWDLDLGVQISILKQTERPKISRPSTRNSSRRNSVNLARGQKLQEEYAAEQARKRHEEEVRWQQEQEAARLIEEEERIQKLKLKYKDSAKRIVTEAVTGVAIDEGTSEYVFRNAWDPPDMVFRKKKISIEDDDIENALPLRQDRSSVSTKTQEPIGLTDLKVALDESNHVDLHRAEVKGRHMEETLTASNKSKESSTSHSSHKPTTASSYSFVRTTVNTSVTNRRFVNGVEISTSTTSGSAVGETMFGTPTGMRSLLHFAQGSESIARNELWKPNHLAIQSHSSTATNTSTFKVKSSTLSEAVESLGELKISSTSESQSSRRSGSKSNRAETLFIETGIRSTTSYRASHSTSGGAPESLYANPNAPVPSATVITHQTHEDDLRELEYFGGNYTHATLPLGSPYMPSTPLVTSASQRHAGGIASGYASRSGSRSTTPGPSTPSRSAYSSSGRTSNSRGSPISSPRSPDQTDANFSNYRIEWNWKELTGKKPRHWSAEEGSRHYDPYNALSTHGSSADSDEEDHNVLESTSDEDSDQDEEAVNSRGGKDSEAVEVSEFSHESGFVIRGGKIARRRSSVALDQREF
ncbi:hypothetical protein BGZ80_002275 [Entomortierella chlamydospora]|uniref:glycogenin glucosyltransferase n=1 Tax=Entomortierella chlamydospora TaxID=101097 RepID=A0A9P6SXC0_9FUNG|nr:hypothetical protein BGZ79_006953 [Entomortierella chlamydospora]KAG0009546.1 hypothetical protein BGZ80_002275 [Entomortierella chlamydospora]